MIQTRRSFIGATSALAAALPYEPTEPQWLRDFLAFAGVPQVAPVNYWDVWTFDASRVKVADSAPRHQQGGAKSEGIHIGHHSFSIPAALTIFPHFCVSACWNLRKSSGLPPSASNPTLP